MSLPPAEAEGRLVHRNFGGDDNEAGSSLHDITV